MAAQDTGLKGDFFISHFGIFPHLIQFLWLIECPFKTVLLPLTHYPLCRKGEQRQKRIQCKVKVHSLHDRKVKPNREDLYSL